MQFRVKEGLLVYMQVDLCGIRLWGIGIVVLILRIIHFGMHIMMGRRILMIGKQVNLEDGLFQPSSNGLEVQLYVGLKLIWAIIDSKGKLNVLRY